MNESTLVKVTLELPAEVVAYFDELSATYPEEIMQALLRAHYNSECGEEDTL